MHVQAVYVHTLAALHRCANYITNEHTLHVLIPKLLLLLLLE